MYELRNRYLLVRLGEPHFAELQHKYVVAVARDGHLVAEALRVVALGLVEYLVGRRDALDEQAAPEVGRHAGPLQRVAHVRDAVLVHVRVAAAVYRPDHFAGRRTARH